MMEQILHQLRLVVYPIIYKGFSFHWMMCCFFRKRLGSTPSTNLQLQASSARKNLRQDSFEANDGGSWRSVDS